MGLRKLTITTFVLGVFVVLAIFMPQQTLACQAGPSQTGCGQKPRDDCRSLAGGGSEGEAYYAAGWYEDYCGGPGYSWHEYTCDGACGAVGGGGGGGGGSCPYTPINCAAGTEVDTTQLVGTSCGQICGVGTSQLMPVNDANCCGSVNIPESGCEWINCPQVQGGPKCEKVCDQPAESWCTRWNIYQYACKSICSTTAPTGLAFSTPGQSLSWTAGTGGTSQKLYVSASKTQVENNCTLSTSPGCIVNTTTASSPYSLAGLMTPGTVYYARVVNSASASCNTNSATLTFVASCSLESPTISVDLGTTIPVNSTVNGSADIDSVTFASGNSGIATVTSPDTTYVYSTNVHGSALGSTTITSNVIIGGASVCTSISAVNVVIPGPWWQVKDSDISSLGDLTSKVPAGEFFGLPNSAGYPGVPAYGGNTNLDGANVSSPGWLVNSTPIGPRVYDYAFFNNQIPKDVLPTALSSTIAGSELESGGDFKYGYYWYKYDGSSSGLDLTINGPTNIGDRKVILMVSSANLYINGTINLNDGQGFFMTSVGKTASLTKGNIYVDPTVGGTAYDLEGIYQADGVFDTGTASITLFVRGSVVGYDGVVMKRDLSSAGLNADPAEFYEYAPDQIMLYPARLGSRKINWKEVAP
ncbi:MAG TPA: hypothetical protein VFI61_01020 [Patescibacteria group bacterium]|nr:hypothetical protein [Patescibacteria group bacterium]